MYKEYDIHILCISYVTISVSLANDIEVVAVTIICIISSGILYKFHFITLTVFFLTQIMIFLFFYSGECNGSTGTYLCSIRFPAECFNVGKPIMNSTS